MLRRIVYLCFGMVLMACAQTVPTLQETYQILEKSEMMYTIDMLDSTYEAPLYEEVVSHGIYLAIDSSKDEIYIEHYGNDFEGKPDLQEVFRQAEQAFQTGNLDSAQARYLRLHDSFPENSQISTYIAQTYGIQGEFDLARTWYTKALQSNPRDYLAHWLLADIFQAQKEIDTAVYHITMAKILNRNNPRLMPLFEKIYAQAGMSYSDWSFTPRIQLQQTDDRIFRIATDADQIAWLGYALCKALWAFEPGYRDSMITEAETFPELYQERICMLQLLNLYEKSKKDTGLLLPSVELALEAAEKGFFDEFIIYEILLKQKPILAMVLTLDICKNIIRYVRAMHTIPSLEPAPSDSTQSKPDSQYQSRRG